MMRAEVRVRRSLIYVVNVALAWGCASLPAATSAPPREGAGPTATTQRPAEVMALVAEAQTRLVTGELEEGLKLLRRATELDPTTGELQEELGLALASANMFDEAVHVLRKIPELDASGDAVLGILLSEGAQTPADLEE